MERQEMVDRLVNIYRLLEDDERFNDGANKIAAANQKFGVRMAAQSLQVWDDVIEIVEKKRLTQNKS